jgi:hypothetical protein
MVASTMAYSMSGVSEQASKSLVKTSALTQSRYRLKTVFQLPKSGGRSRHGLPVRKIQSTASSNRRLSLPLLLGVRRLTQAMRLHLRPLGVCQYESIHPKLESQPSLRSNPDSQQSLGLVASIARPGDNITGVAIVGELKIIERRMGLLAEAMPKLSTIGYLASRPSWEDSRGAAVREAAKRAGHFVVACYAERF